MLDARVRHSVRFLQPRVLIMLKIPSPGTILLSIFHNVKVLYAKKRTSLLACFSPTMTNSRVLILRESGSSRGGGVAALRLLRLLRVLKLLKSFTQLQIILSGLAKGMGSVVWIAVLMAILFYVFACAGISFFR